jgi:predicted transcriptional regulator
MSKQQTEYTDAERAAATIIASLIYPDYPNGPDLTTDASALGEMWRDAIDTVRDPYHDAVFLAPRTGKTYDCPGSAATAWEGLRQMTGSLTNYAKIDPLVRALGGEIVQMQQAAVKRAQSAIVNDMARNGKEVEYLVDLRQYGISAAELQKKDFPALKWIIDGILPEGATLFAGKPKSRKSWLGLAAGVAVASNGKVLGYYDVNGGTVLYLDLESNQRRMKSRLNALIGSSRWPDRLHIYTRWERGEQGVAHLDAWMAAHPDTMLIVIDILQNFRPPRDPKGNPYDQDYEAVKIINEFAERHRIAVLIIHHTRKAKADDVFDEISGTTGLSGGVASMWVLGRTPDNTSESILAVRGRDISDDDPMALKWDNYTCQFVRVASGQEVSSGAARRAILDVMDEEQEYQLKEIAAAVQKSVSAVSNQMRRLMDDNLVQRVGNGRYAKIPQPIAYSSESRESRESDESGISSVSLKGDDFHFHISTDPPMKVIRSLPEQSNGDFHDFHDDSSTAQLWDLSIAEVETKGVVTWQVWDDVTNTMLSEHATKDEAIAEANRRKNT